MAQNENSIMIAKSIQMEELEFKINETHICVLTKDKELLNSNLVKLEYAFENEFNVFVSMCNNIV